MRLHGFIGQHRLAFILCKILLLYCNIEQIVYTHWEQLVVNHHVQTRYLMWTEGFNIFWIYLLMTFCDLFVPTVCAVIQHPLHKLILNCRILNHWTILKLQLNPLSSGCLCANVSMFDFIWVSFFSKCTIVTLLFCCCWDPNGTTC